MPATRTFRAVVFDLFHTLVDPEDFRPKDFYRTHRAAEVCGLDPAAFARHWQDSAPALITADEPLTDWLGRFAAGAGASAAPDALARGAEMLSRYQDHAVRHPRPQVLRALDAVRATGARMGLLSNAFPAEVAGWPASPLAARFDAACFSCAIGRAKPDPLAYAEVLGLLGIGAEEAVFVGDGLGGELAGARAAGFGRVVLMAGFMGRNGLRTPAEMAALRGEAHEAVEALDEVCRLVGGGQA